MDKKEINQIGKKKELTGRQLQDFTKFIFMRFPNENDELYISEWAGRFRDGVEYYKADAQSRAILMKVNGPYYRGLIKSEKDEIKRFKKERGFEDVSWAWHMKLASHSKRRKF